MIIKLLSKIGFWCCLSLFLVSCQTVKPKDVPKAELNEHILFGYPDGDCKILFRVGYVVCYNEETKVADWSSYHLKDSYLVPLVRRSENFRPDPDLKLGKRSELSDYKGSGYDRGHLVPAGDMTRSSITMSESFLLSNMAPQIPSFNRGIWRKLEDRVRDLALIKKNLYIISGPIFQNIPEQKQIGKGVKVPSHFYKIVIAWYPDQPSTLEATGFIIPNLQVSSDKLNNYIVNIDKIERESALDFLHDLEDEIEKKVESNNNLAVWFQN